MMDESQIYRLIREVVRQEMAPVLMGKVVQTNSDNTTQARRFSGEPPIDKQRLLSPYGLASRPKAGTECLIGAIGGDPTHLAVFTHNDAARPAVAAEGDVCLYGPNGQEVYLGADGKIHQGSRAAASAAVLGDVLANCLSDLVDAFVNAAQLGTCSVGPVMLETSIKTALNQVKSKYVTDASTNVLSQKIFLQRS